MILLKNFPFWQRRIFRWKISWRNKIIPWERNVELKYGWSGCNDIFPPRMCTMNGGGKEMLCTTGVKERSGSRERAQSCWPKFVWSKMGEKLKWWWTSRCRRSYRIVGRKRLEVGLDTVTRFSFRAHTFQKSDRVITSVAKSHRPPPFRFF